MTKKNQKRQFCQEFIRGNDSSAKVDSIRPTKTTIIEKMCLWFVKPRYEIDDVEGHTTIIKIFRGKMFIIDRYLNPPKHWNCRSQFQEIASKK